MMNQKTKIFKIILLGIVIAIAVAVTVYLVPVIKDLATTDRSASL